MKDGVGGKPAEGSFRERAALQGRAAPAPSVPGPPGWPGLGPLRGPLPGPGHADAGAPSTPQGRPWSQGLPTRSSCLSHRAASVGDGPWESPMGDQEAVLPGTPSSTDLAWTAGRSSRDGPGLPRKGQEGTASLCQRTVAHVPRKGGLRPLLAGTLGTRVGSTLASDASGSGCPPSLSGSDSADTEQCFSLFQLELLEPLALGGCGCGERCLHGAEPPGDPRGLPGDR